MVKKVNLYLSDKASEKLAKLSRQLGLSSDEFASLCFEYVDISHQGILAAVKRLKQKKSNPDVNKKKLSQHLNQLSDKQIELLLSKAAQKKEKLK